MYESHFGISGPPFQLSPDPSFYFESAGHGSALAALRRGLDAAKGFVVLSGEIGAGKTLLVRTLLEGLDTERVRAAQIVNTQLDAFELLRSISTAFGVASQGELQQRPLQRRLEDHFERLADGDCRALLIVDEAQNLTTEAFLLLFELCGRERAGRAPLQCFLVGQPELRGLLDSVPLAPLAARVAGSFHLGPLAAAETRGYIEHRLRKVGWTGLPSFEADAYAEIFRSTAGVPRLINLLCNRLLLSRFLASQTRIDAEVVRRTARDLSSEIGMPALQPAEPIELAESQVVGAASPAAQAQAPSQTRADRMPAHTPREAQGAAIGTQAREARAAQTAERAPETTPRRAPPARPSPPRANEAGPLLCVVGGHAEHIKCAPLLRALASRADLPAAQLVGTLRNDAFALHRSLYAGLSSVDCRFELDIDAASPVLQLAQIMQQLEPIIDEYRPSALIAIDAGTSALAAALVASAKSVPLVHVGAGLRNTLRRDARESSGLVIDQLADVLYTSETRGNEMLSVEGVAVGRVLCVGNLQVDALQSALRLAINETGSLRPATAREDFVQGKHGYGLVALHRPANVADGNSLGDIVAVLREVSRDLPLIWPMRADVKAGIDRFGLHAVLSGLRIACLPAQPYVEMASLLGNATCVLTDSWAVQEEATALSVPCLTVGQDAPRPTTVEQGSNIVIGSNSTLATRTIWDVAYNGGKRGRVPALWDGQAASRIAAHLADWLARPRAMAADDAAQVWPAAVV